MYVYCPFTSTVSFGEVVLEKYMPLLTDDDRAIPFHVKCDCTTYVRNACFPSISSYSFRITYNRHTFHLTESKSLLTILFFSSRRLN
jgi:hypothetical protein